MIGFHWDYMCAKANFSFFPSFTLLLRNSELSWNHNWELLIWWPLIKSNSQITICLKASELALTSILFMILLPQSFYLEWVCLNNCFALQNSIAREQKSIANWIQDGGYRASELLFFHDKDMAGKAIGIGWRGW